ncbi:MAG: glycosyltransferase, partial [Roseiflexaceae bacterium]|nr:glycosyltransferase [Roseiflexaceae bacterium]
LRGSGERPAMQLAILYDIDIILGLQLVEWLAVQPAAPHTLAPALAALVEQRAALRQAGNFIEADRLRAELRAAGWSVRDTRGAPIVEPRPVEEEFTTITRSHDAPDRRAAPDRFSFSLNLLARDSRADVQRCVESIVRHSAGRDLELVIVDNGSTDDTIPYLQTLVRNGLQAADGRPIALTVLFADHNLGFAAGRNATLRASQGRIAVLVDTSIEVAGDIWTPIARALADETVGYVGPYGLITDDLKEFRESNGPRVDAVEGYLLAFRRALLPEIGLFDEKFRFYRLLDIHHSFYVKTAGYDVLADATLAAQIVKHPHREWYSLSTEEQTTRSKKNYDIFRRRWHHGQSMLTMNYAPENRWFGHDHASHIGPGHTHAPEELPPPGQAHSHTHRHWPDHDHDHLHIHTREE